MRSEQIQNENELGITFFVPCFNEEKNIIPTLITIREVVLEFGISYEVIVVDDGSRDQTSNVIKTYLAKNPEFPILFIQNDRNRGLGYNYMKAAEQTRGKYYIFIAGDNCNSKETIRTLLRERGKADIIIPYINNPEARSFFRRFLSVSFTQIVNFLNGKKVKYYNGPVLQKRENLLSCENIGYGFAYQAEILSQELINGGTYLEVPFIAIQRTSGNSSALRMSNVISVLSSLYRIFKIRLSHLF